MRSALTALFLSLISLTEAFSHQNHPGHAKHNFVIFGESEIFASHIVYKAPHNYQVILKIQLDSATRELYLKNRRANPNDQFIFLLDTMNVAEISQVSSISGAIFRTDRSGNRFDIAKNVRVSRKQYEILFFDELPLSLENAPGITSDELQPKLELESFDDGCNLYQCVVVEWPFGNRFYGGWADQQTSARSAMKHCQSVHPHSNCKLAGCKKALYKCH